MHIFEYFFRNLEHVENITDDVLTERLKLARVDVCKTLHDMDFTDFVYATIRYEVNHGHHAGEFVDWVKIEQICEAVYVPQSLEY